MEESFIIQGFIEQLEALQKKNEEEMAPQEENDLFQAQLQHSIRTNPLKQKENTRHMTPTIKWTPWNDHSRGPRVNLLSNINDIPLFMESSTFPYPWGGSLWTLIDVMEPLTLIETWKHISHR